MEQVRRWDSGVVGKVERTDQGYLRAPATISKVGVFSYAQPGGQVRRELRLPSEVFSPQTLASFGLAPLTNKHPRQPNGKPILLDASNTARYQVGTVVEPKQDGDHVAATIQITDAEAIEAAEAGRRQLSCGYDCGLEFSPGVTAGIPGVPDGLHFDAIQRDIRGNHVALVDSGRAGSTVQLRLDGADAFQVEPDDDKDRSQTNTDKRADARPAGVKSMEAKITIDGVSYDCTPQVEQAVSKVMARVDALTGELATLKTSVSEQTARADAAEESLAAEKKAHADATDPAKLREAVDARLALERTAGPILGSETKLDGMTDAEIKAAVVVAQAKDADTVKARLDGCDAAYLQARFDAAVEGWQPPEEPNAGLAATRKAAKDATPHADAADDARKKMIERHHNAGRAELARKEVH